VVHRWMNAASSDGMDPKEITTPTSAAELIEIVRAAERSKRRVRMMGSGHSFSDVAFTNDHLLLPNGLRTCLPLDRSRLKPLWQPERGLVRTQSGTTIRQLNRRLEALGLAFENLGGYDGQTIVGAASTGTHGSGLRFGPITSQIVSWQVVVAGGRLLQIEPEGGITEPSAFSGRLEENSDIAVELRQDNDLFNAMAVNLGCLGIVYAVVLRAVPLFWIRETRKMVDWEDLVAPSGFLLTLIADEGASLPDDLRHYEVYFNPYAANGRHRTLLTERRIVTRSPPAPLSQVRGTPASAWDAAFAVTGSDWNVLRLMQGLFDEASAGKLITNSLTHMVDPDYRQVSYRVFNLGDLNSARVYGVELAFPLRDTVRVVTRVFQIAEWLARRAPSQRCIHPAPITLRFVKASDAFLAPQQGSATTMMEIGVPVGGNGAEDLLKTYEEALVRELKVRPHWGLDLRYLHGADAVKRIWPDTWKAWLRIRAGLNSSHVFDGGITDRLGISGS
jgi:L-gulono-1,4-lactone dehydrogenase